MRAENEFCREASREPRLSNDRAVDEETGGVRMLF